MVRFFQLRKRNGATTTAHQRSGERLTRRGVVNQFRKRVGKPVWPSSTRTRLSIQKPSGSTATEDTDEISEKIQHDANEFVAEVGTDGGDDASCISGSNDSRSEEMFNRSLETIEESLNQSKSQQPSTTRNSSILTKSHSKSISVISRVEADSKEVQVETTTPASTPPDTPVSETELQVAGKQFREKQRNLESLRKTLSSFRTSFQDHAAIRSMRYSPRTPNTALSFWCQPDLLCSAQTAGHLLPIDVSLSLPTSDSTQSWSTSGDAVNRTAVSFIDNVLDQLVGQDTQEESTVFGTVMDVDSVMDDTAIGESVIFAANLSARGEGQRLESTRQTRGQSTKIMETLAEWDEMDDELENELGQYDPTNRGTGQSLSFEFSESWGYADDDETEMTGASAYTTD